MFKCVGVLGIWWWAHQECWDKQALQILREFLQLRWLESRQEKEDDDGDDDDGDDDGDANDYCIKDDNGVGNNDANGDDNDIYNAGDDNPKSVECGEKKQCLPVCIWWLGSRACWLFPEEKQLKKFIFEMMKGIMFSFRGVDSEIIEYLYLFGQTVYS